MTHKELTRMVADLGYKPQFAIEWQIEWPIKISMEEREFLMYLHSKNKLGYRHNHMEYIGMIVLAYRINKILSPFVSKNYSDIIISYLIAHVIE